MVRIHVCQLHNDKGGDIVGVATSLLLSAAGAILIWAVDYQVNGVDLDAVGVILLIVGLVGLLLSLVFWSSLGTYGFGEKEEKNTTIFKD